MQRLSASWAIALALASGCASMPTGGTPANLVGTHWLRVDDDNACPHFPTLGFGEDTASGVLPGCDDWSADVRTTGATLSFAHLEPTHLQCGADSAVGAAARSLMSALAATRSARLSTAADGSELTLFDARGEQVARFASN